MSVKTLLLALCLCTGVVGCQTTPPSTFLISKFDLRPFFVCQTAECICADIKCKLVVDTTSCGTTGGNPTVVTQKLRVQDNQDVRIVWVLRPIDGPWVFDAADGIKLKSSSSPDITGQFYHKFIADGGDNPDPTLKRGPRFHWRDANRKSPFFSNTFEYEINLVNTDTGAKCRADPQIFNDG